MPNYAKAKTTLDEVANRITQASQDIDAGRDRIEGAKADLDGMPQQYSDVIEAIQNAPADNEAWAALKAQLAELTQEYQSLSDNAGNILTAIDGV